MSSSKEFEISRLLELSRDQKYATTVAAFEVIDMIEQIDLPKKVQNRKPAVKALTALHDQLVQWDFISEEERLALEEELGPSPRSQLDGIFGPAGEEPPPPPPDRPLRPLDGEEEENEFGDEEEDESSDSDFDDDSEDEDEDEDEEEEEEDSDSSDFDDDEDEDEGPLLGDDDEEEPEEGELEGDED
ncbi:MAG: DNA primase [Leptospirales bacterium]|nr:DNA primase [Leptospirales bacterium]